MDLRDLPVTLPSALLSDPVARARVSLHGVGDTVVIEATTDGPVGLHADARATLRPGAPAAAGSRGSPPGLEARLDWRADLSAWTSAGGELSGGLDATLDRLATDAGAHVHGTLTRRVPSGALGPLAAASLRADFDVSRPDPSSADRPGAADATAVLSRFERSARGRTGEWTRLGTVGARIGKGHADWRVDLRLDSGSVRGRGGVTWKGDAPLVRVDTLGLERLDAARLASGLPETSISGAVSGRLQGRALDALSGGAELSLRPSSIGGRTLDTLRVAARLTPGVARGHLSAALGSRHVGTDYRVGISDTLVTALLSSLRITTSDSADASGPPATDLTARATGSWALGTGIRRGGFQIDLDTTTLSTLSASGGRVRGRIVGDSLLADARLDVRAGSAGPASFTATLRTAGLTPARATGRFEARAVRPHERQAAGNPADTLALAVTADEPGRFTVGGYLRPAEGGRIDLEGHASADSMPAFDLAARGSLPDSVDLLGDATIDSLAVTAAGTRDSVGWRRLRGRVTLRDAAWRGIVADRLLGSFRSDSSGLRLDTLSLESNVVALTGHGELPLGGADAPGRVQVDGDRLDLRPLRRLSPVPLPALGNSELHVVLAGALDSLELTGGLSLEALAYESGVQVRGLDLDGRASIRAPFGRALGLTAGTAHLGLGRLSLPDADVRGIDVRLEGGPDSLRVVASADVDDDRSGEMHLTIDPRPDRRSVRIERVDLRLDRDRWHLRAPSVLSYRDGYTIDSFALEDGSAQSIRVDGGVDAADSLDLRIEVDSTSVNAVADLLGVPTLRGWIDGTARLGGTPSAPRGRIDLSAGLGPQGAPPATLDLTLAAAGDSLSGQLALDGPAGGRARVRGAMPLPGSGAADRGVDLSADADSLRVSFLLPFFPADAVADLDGRLDARLTGHGRGEDLRLEGPLSLRDGRIRLPRLGVEWTDVVLSARGSGADLVLDTARVRSGSGTVSASGRVSVVDSLALDLSARFDDFRAIDDDAYRADVSGRMRATGSVARPVLDGSLQVESLDAYLGQHASTSGLEDIQLSAEDLQTLRERFGYVADADRSSSAGALDRLSADLDVRLGRDSWLRKRSDPQLAVAFTGDVHVRLRPGEQPVLDGSVQTIEGRGFVEQFGKRFALREGTVTFDGPPSAATVDLSATYTIPSHDNPDDAEATIVLGISGTTDSLSLTLSSEPEMENADIVSYIATGHPASGSLGLGADSTSQAGGSHSGLVAAGESLALGQLTGLIEGTAQQTVGLDVVEIRRQGLREATLVAGKYVSPRLYVGFAQPITLQGGDGLSLGGEGQSEVEIEVEALRWLLLNFEGSGSALRVFLRGRYAY